MESLPELIDVSAFGGYESLGSRLFRLEFPWGLHRTINRDHRWYFTESNEFEDSSHAIIIAARAGLRTIGSIHTIADHACEGTFPIFISRKGRADETGLLYHC